MSLQEFLDRCVHIDRADVSDKRGEKRFVYLLLLGGEVVYVGATSEVMRRLIAHTIFNPHVAFGHKEFDSAKWFEVDGLPTSAYEGALIRALNPRFCFGAPVEHPIGDAAVLARLGLIPHPANAAAFAAKESPNKIRGDVRRRRNVRHELWLAVKRVLRNVHKKNLAITSCGSQRNTVAQLTAGVISCS